MPEFTVEQEQKLAAAAKTVQEQQEWIKEVRTYANLARWAGFTLGGVMTVLSGYVLWVGGTVARETKLGQEEIQKSRDAALEEVHKTGAKAASELNAVIVPIGTVVAYAGVLYVGDLMVQSADEIRNVQKVQDSVRAGGWRVCDGSSMIVDENPKLFDALRYAHGRTTVGTKEAFRLPDLRGAFLRAVCRGDGDNPEVGADPDRDTRTGTSAGNTGNKVGSVQQFKFPAKKMGLSGLIPGIENYVFQDDPQDHTPFSVGEVRPTNVYVYYLIRVR